ncbi:sensor domain-containing diguanylate cyclase [Salisediminibacterium selenitireducens]|uniref:Diguanylate cyclase n=1 Tax=Bacillus selenitireducens (strain ATCC 700615 / DSM 15326 / MLS10) TaxID=439292 RepID=D6XZ61_BACIE|nr:GGDEF domain-containing protein [Salisediminibacterium selenitireducens]ADI00346.1 diguanylate cyclase [[Bacillus] selenitireducens MLS10]
MELILGRTKMISLVLVMIILVITFISFYFPMKSELEQSYISNFDNSAETTYTAVEAFINRSIETTEGITSRTAIREAMYDYHSGIHSFAEVQSFVEPRYLEGLSHVSRMVEAQRVMDQQVLAGSNQDRSDPFSFRESGTLEISFLFNLDPVLLQIVSPIIEQQQTVGYDVIRFNLGQYVASIANSDLSIEMLTPEMTHSLQSMLTPHETTAGIYLSDETIYRFYDLPESSYSMYVAKPKSVLFETVDRVIRISFIAFFLGISALFIVLNYLISRNAKQMVDQAETSRDQYREKAYTDELTGAGSRTYLNRWIDKEIKAMASGQDHYYSFVMVDANKFKDINDEYGHIVGDRVLKEMAEAMMEAVRDDDLVIRYGGDEFLVILRNTRKIHAGMIMERIKEKLKNTSIVSDPVSFTYGISEVRKKEELKHAIRDADEMMYEMKKKEEDS